MRSSSKRRNASTRPCWGSSRRTSLRLPARTSDPQPPRLRRRRHPLQRYFAELLPTRLAVELLQRCLNRFGDPRFPGPRAAREACRDVHGVADVVVASLARLADVDADPNAELPPTYGGKISHRLQDPDRGPDRIGGVVEHGHRAVAERLDDPAFRAPNVCLDHRIVRVE